MPAQLHALSRGSREMGHQLDAHLRLNCTRQKTLATRQLQVVVRGRIVMGAAEGSAAPSHYALSKGMARLRAPVAAKIAFATAGATGGTPGSPTPPMG